MYLGQLGNWGSKQKPRLVRGEGTQAIETMAARQLQRQGVLQQNVVEDFPEAKIRVEKYWEGKWSDSEEGWSHSWSSSQHVLACCWSAGSSSVCSVLRMRPCP